MPGIFPEFKMEADNYDIPMLLTGVPYACAIPGSSLYVLTNIQIHTGRAGKPGSEHLVQGRAYDGEVSCTCTPAERKPVQGEIMQRQPFRPASDKIPFACSPVS